MKRLLLVLAAGIGAAGIAAVPAVAGLAGNPSFSHQLPVPVPSQARVAQFVDDSGQDASPASVPATATPTTTRAGHPEPGDDRGRGSGEPEPGDDRSGRGRDTATPTAEPGDDHSGRGRDTATPTAEPGDDHSGHGGDDRSGHGGGGDDHSGHGGADG